MQNMANRVFHAPFIWNCSGGRRERERERERESAGAVSVAHWLTPRSLCVCVGVCVFARKCVRVSFCMREREKSFSRQHEMRRLNVIYFQETMKEGTCLFMPTNTQQEKTITSRAH